MADREGEALRFESIQLPLDSNAAVRPGKFDPTSLMVLWVLRCAAPTMLIAGLIYARLITERRFESLPEVVTPAQAWRVLLSPFAGIAIAVALRFMVGIAALALAYPLSRRATGSAMGPDFRRPFTVWADRLHLVRAYRSLRWTTSVRNHAACRIGRWGRALRLGGPVLLIADFVLVVALLVVVVLNPRTSTPTVVTVGLSSVPHESEQCADCSTGFRSSLMASSDRVDLPR